MGKDKLILCVQKKKKKEWILWPYFRKIGRDLGKKLAGGRDGGEKGLNIS